MPRLATRSAVPSTREWRRRSPQQAVCEALSDRTDSDSEGWGDLHHLFDERRPKAAYTSSSLDHVTTAKLTLFEQVENELVRDRSDRLHQVDREASSVAHIGMHQPNRGVEAHGVRGEHGLGLHDRIGEVESRVNWRHSPPRPLAIKLRRPRSSSVPVLWHVAPQASVESDREE